MKFLSSNLTNVDVEKQFSLLAGKLCWHVSVGGFSDSTFSLHLGRKLPRKKQLSEGHPDSFRNCVGEFYIYVWSYWISELKHGDQVDSESERSKIEQRIESLDGRMIALASLDLELRTATVFFDNDVTLKILGSNSVTDDWMEFANSGKNFALENSGAVLIDSRKDWVQIPPSTDEIEDKNGP